MTKKNDFTPKVKAQGRDRADDHCEFPGCNRFITTYHHRLRRAQGGMGTLDNLLCLCIPHHELIHANVDGGSYVQGWLLHAKPVNTGLKAS
jgi:hypothetical protein